MSLQLIVGATVRLLVAAMLMIASAAQAAEIKILTANAVKEAIVELVSAFEKASGHKVNVVWGGTVGLTKRVNDGEIFDIVLVGSDNIDKLIADRKLAPGSRADFAKSGVGVAVRSGLPKPDVSSTDALKKYLLSSKSLAYSAGPSGAYVDELLKKLGISGLVKDRVKQPSSGAEVAQLLVQGKVDFGFAQVSELVNAKGITYLGPLPSDIQNMTVYSTGMHPAAPSVDAAKALVKFFTAPAAGPIIRKIGMEPG